jgi:hypothetical protein
MFQGIRFPALRSATLSGLLIIALGNEGQLESVSERTQNWFGGGDDQRDV